MVLIVGGAYQGKLSWAVKEYHLTDDDICDLATGFVPGKRCYFHLEELTRRNEPADFPPDAIVVAQEIGGGIVPLSGAERAWRERHGACLQELASQAERVVRIFCGLPEVLK